MPRLEFIQQSSLDPANPQANPGRLVNFYPEPLPAGSRAAIALKAVPGTQAFATVPGVFVRAMANVVRYDEDGVPSDRLVLVSDGALRSVDASGGVSAIGSVADDEETAISGNNGDVTVIAGGNYYLWNGAALTQPAGAVFSNFGGVEFLGDYTILTEKNDRRFCWTDLADASTLPALNFATAESRDDVILRPMAIGGNLWLFKATSIEIWYPTGAGGPNAFARVGPVLETGLKAFGLACKIPGGAFFVGDDGIAYVTGGTTQLQPVSGGAVNEVIRAGEATAAFYYEDTGHKFCVLRFRDRPAWVYDIVTGAWHERATGENGPWGATCAASAYGSWRFGGFNGAVRTAVRSNEDAGEPLMRRVVSLPMGDGAARFRVPVVQVFGQIGRSDLGRDAHVMIRFSRDGGMTWGTWREASMGALGEYGARAVFRNCGQARVLVAEVRVTDPADLTIWSAAEVQVA
jgi:hypothetical protein